MAVYVDDVRLPFRSMVMCHMWADTRTELLAMADRIGVARRWIQVPPDATWVHFDISLRKKDLALALGAVLTDRYGPAEHVARIDVASQDPGRVARGARKLAQIEGLRRREPGPPPPQLQADLFGAGG